MKTQYELCYRGSFIATAKILADKVGMVLDESHLNECSIEEIEQLRDNLIEAYNLKIKAKS